MSPASRKTRHFLLVVLAGAFYPGQYAAARPRHLRSFTRSAIISTDVRLNPGANDTSSSSLSATATHTTAGLIRSRVGAINEKLHEDWQEWHAGREARQCEREERRESKRIARQERRESKRAAQEGSINTKKASPPELQAENDANLDAMLKLVQGDGWTFVSEDTGGPNPITVYKKTVPPGTHVQSASGEADEAAAEKHACIKVTALLDAAPHDLYRLFLDNSRVAEYNEHCALLEDVETCSKDTKVSWSVTGSFGPFKPREFVTMVHYTSNKKTKALVVVNRPATHPTKPVGNKYQRGEILLAGNIMQPVEGEPNQTRFTMITHVNPGGIVDNPLCAKIMNRLAASAPIEFVQKLETAAKR